MNFNKQTKEQVLARLYTIPKLWETVLYCAENKALVEQFDRLNKSNMALRGSSLELMIDKATGKQEQDIIDFIAFVDECIFQRVKFQED
jgi:hypothetical protein